jgi:hypothetical protein
MNGSIFALQEAAQQKIANAATDRASLTKRVSEWTDKQEQMFEKLSARVSHLEQQQSNWKQQAASGDLLKACPRNTAH